jgi:hypothetical protein
VSTLKNPNKTTKKIIFKIHFIFPYSKCVNLKKFPALTLNHLNWASQKLEICPQPKKIQIKSCWDAEKKKCPREYKTTI